MAVQQISEVDRRCYIYEIIVDGVVRYIGKGTGDRASRHIAFARNLNLRRAAGEKVRTQKFYNLLAKAIKAGSKVGFKIVRSGLTSKEAFSLEISAISAAPNAQLWNILSGGQGADSDHFKRNWSNPVTRERMLTCIRSEESRKKGKARAAIQWSDQSARDKNRNKVSQQWRDPEFRRKRVEALERSVRSPERRRHAAMVMKAKWADPQFRKSQSARIKAASMRPEKREQFGSRVKALWLKPGMRERIGRKVSEAHLSSGKMKSIWLDPEYRKRRQESAKRGWISRRRNLSMSSPSGGDKNTKAITSNG